MLLSIESLYCDALKKYTYKLSVFLFIPHTTGLSKDSVKSSVLRFFWYLYFIILALLETIALDDRFSGLTISIDWLSGENIGIYCFAFSEVTTILVVALLNRATLILSPCELFGFSRISLLLIELSILLFTISKIILVGFVKIKGF